MKNALFGLTATLALAGSTHATVLVDGFESYSSVGDTMNGKGNWLVGNGSPATPGDGPVAILDTSNWVGGETQAATVGGIQQTSLGLTSLYDSTLSVPLASTTPQPTFFLIETQYAESDAGARNPYSFVLNIGAANLLTISLTPGGGGEYNTSWSSDYATGGTFGTLANGALTSFRLDTWESAPGVVSYKFSNAGSDVSTGVLTGANPTDLISKFAVNWDSSPSFGNGFITVDNISVVPETSSAILGMLGVSFGFLRRRRA